LELQLEDGRSLSLDEQGYLADWTEWSDEVADAFARLDGIELREEHRVVISLLREFYREYEIAPPMRGLLKLLRRRLDDESLSSRQLYRLFPGGPAKQACRYAGLPRPVSCI
jgi:tRNA 2-thiouridine synthesizing protein E